MEKHEIMGFSVLRLERAVANVEIPYEPNFPCYC